jgi:cell division septation protein DedD
MTGLDTALRNRLTGAVILVLIAVLLLPELLSGSGGASGAGTATGASNAGVVTEPVGGASLQTLQIDLSGSANAPAGSPSAALPDAPEAAAPASSPVQLPVPVVAAPAEDTPPKTASSTAVPQVTAPKAATATPDPAQDATRYYVQVGTFATRERAEAAKKDLTRRGFVVIINETTSVGRRFHRVRVGPVADRAAAVELEARLRPLVPDRSIVAVPPSP